MPVFNVVGIREKSGRAMRKTYRGFDEAEVRALALHRDGLIAKWIEQHPYKPATDSQKQRLAQLGYRFSAGLNVKEAGDLLRALLSGDQPVDKQILAYARQLRIETTTYVGTKQLYDAIFRKLLQPGNEQHLVAWFTFRVYRTLAAGDNRAIICGPEHVVIQRIAQYLLRDAEVMGAIRQYRAGREWIRFGHCIDSKGQVQRGGRMDTVAYRRARACFEKAFTEIPLLRPPISSDAGSTSISASLLAPLLPATDKVIHHRTLASLKAS
jgi:hypothetical protein